jgi:dipeptidyl aminopeptidase/acylaminoacyl peptidase
MPISISDLFNIPNIWGIDLASDGKTVLYCSDVTGVPHLYLLRTQLGSRPKQITTGNDPVIFGYFSPSGNSVAYLRDKDGNELHHVFLMSKKGKKPTKITKEGYRTFDVGWHPNEAELARVYSTKTSCNIEICDLKTTENLILRQQKTPLLDVKYSHDGKWMACTEYGGGKDPRNNQITVVNRRDPTDTIVFSFKDGSKEILPSWSHDDKKLAFLSDVRGRNQVVVQGFQSKERIFLDLEEGEEAIETAYIGWAPTNDRVYYIVSKHSRRTFYEHTLDGERTPLPFPKGAVYFGKVSADGKKIVAGHSSISKPPNIYLHEVGSSFATPLIRQKSKINLSDLAKPKSVWYKSTDGLKIHAWYLPAGYARAPHPAIVWPHGGPWYQTNDLWDPYLQSLSQSGFAVLAPNFRGSTGYGAGFRNMDISDPGGGDLEDVVAGAKWLAKQREIDRSKIAISGGSYGGYMTLIALTKKPEIFAAGAAFIPITDWLEMYQLSDALFRRFTEEIFEGPPEKKQKLYRDRSPITYVSQIKAPVLISCGRNDSRCPIQPVSKFVGKLRKMKHPHKFRVEEKEGHGAVRVEAAKREVTTIVKYLKQTLRIR